MTRGAGPSSAPPRIVFLDALRLVAAFQMIQGHTIDAMLAPDYRTGSTFETWTYVRGLTSTAFLFAAGLSFALVTADDLRRRKSRAHRVRRALKLMFIGYLMHAPFAALFGVPWAAAVREASIVDVLQNIGISLFALELIADLFSIRGVRFTVAFALASACFVLAPLTDALVPSGPLLLFLQYLTARGGSLFPLLPWSGYIFAGYCAGLFVVPRGLGSDRALATQRLGYVTIIAFASAWLLFAAFGTQAGKVAPGFAVLKLGLVSAVSFALSRALLHVNGLPKWALALASETLFLYVSHVLVLYAAVVGVKAQFGSTFSPWASVCSALLLMVVCSACALSYGRAKEALRARRAGGREAS